MKKPQLSATVITLHPELFPGPLSASVTGRALEKKIWSLETIDLRVYGKGKHKQVDDKPISGGARNGFKTRCSRSSFTTS